ncbi:hypothetical protein FOMPIDRAFT_116462 [Fomitopsis schrenkii]|uniref:Uncharacterized protein n=1 Tax=Fomitopsis schrenkii TaxID=2126942 RepID=S8DNS3_FOMSC|nr:hypothetical protein FOMPIDRAFT_116462 [Fomitopsis schrenkii]
MSYRTPRSEIENRATRELTYETKFDLTGIHEKRITGVAISPEGRYVATCSEDCSITLWLVRTGEATHRIVARSAVLCATWPSDPATLICGTADGTLLTIAISSVSMRIQNQSNTWWLTKSPLPPPFTRARSQERSSGLGGGSHLQVTMKSKSGYNTVKILKLKLYFVEWMLEQLIKHPPPTSQSDKKPFLVTALQWLAHGDEAPDDLVVAYLFHGIYCTHLDASGAQQVKWSIHLSLWYLSLSRTNEGLETTTIAVRNTRAPPSPIHSQWRLSAIRMSRRES